MLLENRHDAAILTAKRLVETAGNLSRSSARLRDESSRIRSDVAVARARRQRRISGARTEAWFTVRGVVDGVPTIAHWSPDELDCDPEVQRRAMIVVALGETFSDEGSIGRVVSASLDGPPIAVLLTVMRAFSAVTAIELSIDMLSGAEAAPSD